MTTIQNLHSHTIVSDGKSTFREMIESAEKHGLKSLGFSDHMYTGIPLDVAGMDKSDIDIYFDTLQELKKTSSIEIFTGIELESRDGNNNFTTKDKRVDYAIGSIHFFHKQNELHYVDWDTEHYLLAVEAFGTEKAMCENYFTEMVEYARYSDYDITGHFDLFTKFLDMTDMSFTSSKWYKDMALNALEEVAKCGKIFELNTGGISREFRTTPYPQNFILEHIRQIKAPIIISSDCHYKDWITCWFNEAEELLKSMGFKSQMILTKSGFTDFPL